MTEPAWYSGFQHPGTQQIFWNTNHVSSMCRGCCGPPPHSFRTDTLIPTVSGTLAAEGSKQSASLRTALRREPPCRDVAPFSGSSPHPVTAHFWGTKVWPPFNRQTVPPGRMQTLQQFLTSSQFYASLQPVPRAHCPPSLLLTGPGNRCTQVSVCFQEIRPETESVQVPEMQQ